jgi:hypothetical protein
VRRAYLRFQELRAPHLATNIARCTPNVNQHSLDDLLEQATVPAVQILGMMPKFCTYNLLVWFPEYLRL